MLVIVWLLGGLERLCLRLVEGMEGISGPFEGSVILR